MLIDEASEIEVIDLPPDELLTRLQEGKVYIPEQAARAIQKFFRKGNLTALREMSLRRAAERVDDQMRAYMQTRAIPGPWPAGERLLVCISPSPLAEKLIRTTRRLADELNAEWFAVYVEVASKPENNPANRERIGQHPSTGRGTGCANPAPWRDVSIHEAVLEFARKNNITKIVIGKPLKPRWQEWFTGSIVDQLMYASGDIDVYVISAQPEVRKVSLPGNGSRIVRWDVICSALDWSPCPRLIGVSVRGNPRTGQPGHALPGWLCHLGHLPRPRSIPARSHPVCWHSTIFLIHPYLTFAVSDTQYIVTFIGLFIVSLVVSSLTVRVREQADAAVQRRPNRPPSMTSDVI